MATTARATAPQAAPTSEANICHLMPKFAAKHGDAIALAEADPASLAKWTKLEERIGLRKLTWRELEDRVAICAGGLKKLGFQPGDRAMIFAPLSWPSRPAFAITTRIFLATWVSI